MVDDPLRVVRNMVENDVDDSDKPNFVSKIAHGLTERLQLLLSSERGPREVLIIDVGLVSKRIKRLRLAIDLNRCKMDRVVAS